jgi:hypothetical protein
MKKFYIMLLLLPVLFSSKTFSQDIEVIVHAYSLSDTLGAEIVFDFEVINISTAEQIVFEVRTLNDLPDEWTSSLCFGELCFAPHLDSIATVPEFLTPPLAPGDTLYTSLHVFTLTNEGIANVQLQVGTFHDPNNRITLDFTATVGPTSVKDSELIKSYALLQNYPNPFNPATSIAFNLKADSQVSLKVYNLLGQEIKSLVNKNMQAGSHSINFNASSLNSGVYFYRLEAAGVDGSIFNSVKKMILTK